MSTSSLSPDGRRPAGSTPRRSLPRHPALGLVPSTARGRVLWAWGVVNVVLALLPVWGLAFNDGQLAGGFLPVTILWSYLVFTSNLMLVVTFSVVWGRPWAATMDDPPLNPDTVSGDAKPATKQEGS